MDECPFCIDKGGTKWCVANHPRRLTAAGDIVPLDWSKRTITKQLALPAAPTSTPSPTVHLRVNHSKPTASPPTAATTAVDDDDEFTRVFDFDATPTSAPKKESGPVRLHIALSSVSDTWVCEHSQTCGKTANDLFDDYKRIDIMDECPFCIEKGGTKWLVANHPRRRTPSGTIIWLDWSNRTLPKELTMPITPTSSSPPSVHIRLTHATS